ncbi:MAG: hypothetical protein U9R34_04370 [Nanoarchaeota archaeon]|nr:hypothetical protein [Nanoarchaeota archaeon]
MRNYKISKGAAIDLQEWALEFSSVKNVLKSLPQIPDGSNNKIEEGLYVDYSIDEEELDGGADWPDIGVVTIYAVLNDQKIYFGEIRAYNQEMIWLSTREDEEVDTVENWFELIKEDYEALVQSKNEDK